MITNSQASILQHTRDRAAVGFYCGDSAEMQSLVKLGFMQDAGHKGFVPDPYFSLTRAGREALVEWEKAQPKPVYVEPKRTRSRAFEAWFAWRAAGSYATFSEFWKNDWPLLKHRY